MLRRIVPLIFWAVNFTGQLPGDLGFRSNLGMGTFRFRERERERERENVLFYKAS